MRIDPLRWLELAARVRLRKASSRPERRARIAAKDALAAEKAARKAARAEQGWRRQFVRTASRVTPYVAVEKEGVLYFLSTEAQAGRGRFEKLSWKEERHLSRALHVLEVVGVEVERTTFLDVGAHIGTTTIDALRRHKFAAALAFEPEAENYRLLRVNLVANRLEGRARTYNVALSNSDGVGELRLAARGSGSHKLVTEPTLGDVRRVPMTTLDSLLAREGVDPGDVGLLWLDAEGHDAEVLEGATELLRRSVPIVMELSARKMDGAQLDPLHSRLSATYTSVVDLRPWFKGEHDVLPLAALDELARRYQDHFTDVLVFRRPPEPAG